MASRRRDLGRPLLLALCVVALLAVGSDSHGLEDFSEGKTEATPAMASFFGAKPEAAELPEALDAATAKPEAASAIPVATTTTTASSSAAPHARRSVSVAAGVACGVAAVAVVGVAVAVAYVVRARRNGARREPEVRLGSSP